MLGTLLPWAWHSPWWYNAQVFLFLFVYVCGLESESDLPVADYYYFIYLFVISISYFLFSNAFCNVFLHSGFTYIYVCMLLDLVFIKFPAMKFIWVFVILDESESWDFSVVSLYLYLEIVWRCGYIFGCIWCMCNWRGL